MARGGKRRAAACRPSQERAAAQAVLDRVAEPPAQRSLCRRGAPAWLSLARRLQAAPARRAVPPAAAGAAGRRSRLRAGRLGAGRGRRGSARGGVPSSASIWRRPSRSPAPRCSGRFPRPRGRSGDPRRARRRRRSRAERHGGAGDRPCRDRPSARSSRWPRTLLPSPRPCCSPAARLSPRCSRAAPRAPLLATLKRAFAEVRHAKPAASRAESAETYVVAKGLRGRRDP